MGKFKLPISQEHESKKKGQMLIIASAVDHKKGKHCITKTKSHDSVALGGRVRLPYKNADSCIGVSLLAIT